MSTKTVLFAGRDNTSNPEPSGFTGLPYVNDVVAHDDINLNYLSTNGIDVFVVNQSVKLDKNTNRDAGIKFVPSDPEAEYTVTLWSYCRLLNVWTKIQSLPTQSYVGPKTDYIGLEGLYGELCYFSIDAIDSGTLSCVVDGAVLLVYNEPA